MEKDKKNCPVEFVHTLNLFVEHLRLKSLRESTIKFQKTQVEYVLQLFKSYGIKDLAMLESHHIVKVYEDIRDKHNLPYPLKSFLRFLLKNGIIKNDLSAFVQKPKKNYPVPSVYTKDEMERFLHSVSLENNSRNYAIILLALRLGMRTGDIKNLRLHNVDFISKKINFIQAKTQVPHCIELVPEVEQALKDYLVDRPKSSYDHIFLSIAPPYLPGKFCLHRVIKRNLMKSGILIGKRKAGLHSLRMTFASELIQENVPYNVVGKLLGHENYTSAKRYIKFDVEALRNCALEVPKLSGIIAEFLNNTKENLPL